jgi:hypothetical protein
MQVISRVSAKTSGRENLDFFRLAIKDSSAG